MPNLKNKIHRTLKSKFNLNQAASSGGAKIKKPLRQHLTNVTPKLNCDKLVSAPLSTFAAFYTKNVIMLKASSSYDWFASHLFQLVTVCASSGQLRGKVVQVT